MSQGWHGFWNFTFLATCAFSITMAVEISIDSMEKAWTRMNDSDSHRRRAAHQVEHNRRLIMTLDSQVGLANEYPHESYGLISWDPPTLHFGWWGSPKLRNSGGESDNTALVREWCAKSAVHMVMPDVFGHLNNVLIEYANLLRDCVSRSPPATLVLPRAYRRFVGTSTFDVTAATSSWSCIDVGTTEGAPGLGAHKDHVHEVARVEIRNASDVYFDRVGTSGIGHGNQKIDTRNGISVEGSRNYLASESDDGAFVSEAIAQLLLRPSPPLRKLVEEFEASLFRGHNLRTSSTLEIPASRNFSEIASNRAPKHYVAIHLRAFGPNCRTRVSRALQRGKQTLQWVTVDEKNTNAEYRGREKSASLRRRRAVAAEDICGMTDAYVDAALESAGVPKDWPVVLAHDGQDPKRAAAMTERYRAVSYQGPMANFVDLLLMVRAGYFIGNPASSFSANAARVRHAVRPHDPATTLRCGGPRGPDPAQC